MTLLYVSSRHSSPTGKESVRLREFIPSLSTILEGLQRSCCLYLEHTILPICLKYSEGKLCVHSSSAYTKKEGYVLGVWTDLNPYHVLPHTFHLHAHTWWDETLCGKTKSQKLTLVLLPCSSVELHGTWTF